MWVVMPALVGYGLGMHLFGDVNEAYRLQMHHGFYKKEFANFKQELYYS